MKKKYWIPFYIGFVFLCTVLSPVVYFTELSFLYNEKRIIVTLVLLFTGWSIVFFSQEKIKRVISYFSSTFWAGFLLVLSLSIISGTLSSFPFYSIVEICLFILLFWVALLAAYVTDNYIFGKYAIIISACFFVLFYELKFGLGYTFHLLEFKNFPLWPASGLKTGTIGFANIRFFNQVQIFTLPLLLGGSLLAIQSKKNVGYFLLALSAFWWMLLIGSAGRGIILSALTAALVTLYLFKEYTHRWIWYFIGTLVVGYIAKFLLFDIIPPDSGFSKSLVRGGSPRITLYPQTFLASLNSPIFGHGPMSFANINSDFFRGHPHNSILQLLYEFGYPITIAILGGAFYGLKKWIEQTNERIDAIKDKFNKEVILRISLTVAIFGGLLYSLFSGVIVMPLSQLWLALVSGTMLGLYVKYSSKEEYLSPIKPYKIIVFKLILLLASITLASVLIKDVPHLRENEKRYLEQTDRNILRPRFWQQGKIGFDEKQNSEERSNIESNL